MWCDFPAGVEAVRIISRVCSQLPAMYVCMYIQWNSLHDPARNVIIKRNLPKRPCARDRDEHMYVVRQACSLHDAIYCTYSTHGLSDCVYSSGGPDLVARQRNDGGMMMVEVASGPPINLSYGSSRNHSSSGRVRRARQECT